MGGSNGGLLEDKSVMNIDGSRPVLPQIKNLLTRIDDFKQNTPLVNRVVYNQTLLCAKKNLWRTILRPHALVEYSSKSVPFLHG